MKKIYIEPKNTVVRISMEMMIAQSGKIDESQEVPNNGEYYTPGGREVINTPDAWEEW